MNYRKSKFQLILSLFLVLIIANSVNLQTTNRVTEISDWTVQTIELQGSLISSYTIHSPIVINSNSDFSSQGFLGDGTESNPYLIEGYNITATAGICITISDTNAFFVIRNCFIRNEGSYTYCIRLNQVTQGEIRNNTVVGDSGFGVTLFYSSNIDVANNSFIEQEYGLYLSSSSDNLVTNNTIVDNSVGIRISGSNNEVKNNTISENIVGVMLESSSNNVVSSNIFVNNGIRIRGDQVEDWQQTITTDNLMNDKPIGYFWNLASQVIDVATYGQVILANCNDVTIKNGDFNETSIGILLGHSSFCTVINNTVSNGETGVGLAYCIDSIVMNNAISGNYEGLFFTYSSSVAVNNTISENYWGVTFADSSSIAENNTILENRHSVYLVSATDCTITNNTIRDSRYSGIYLYDSSENTVANNTLASNGNNRVSVHLWNSPENILSDNNLLDGRILIEGNLVNHWKQNITLDNLIDGKSVGYFWGLNSGNIESVFYSQIILANCTGVTVENCDGRGILLGHSSFCNLINNTVNDTSGTGIQLVFSSFNVIGNNTISGLNDGVSLSSSMNNTIINNNISIADHDAIDLRYSMNNTVISNYITENYNGIHMYWASFNRIANNTIKDNNWNCIGYTESMNNTIQYNELSESAIGIDSYTSSGNNILNNSIHDTSEGIRLIDTSENLVRGNFITRISNVGVYLYGSASNNEVVNNTITICYYGIRTTSSSHDNLAYLNRIACTNNAFDLGTDNQWNYTSLGNYWSDYSGTGVYTILGSAGSIDYHPSIYASESLVPTTTQTYPTYTTTTTTSTSTTSTNDALIGDLVIGVVLFTGIAVVIVIFLKQRTSPTQS